MNILHKQDLAYCEGKLAKNENNVHFIPVNGVINQRLKIIVESKKSIE